MICNISNVNIKISISKQIVCCIKLFKRAFNVFNLCFLVPVYICINFEKKNNQKTTYVRNSCKIFFTKCLMLKFTNLYIELFILCLYSIFLSVICQAVTYTQVGESVLQTGGRLVRILAARETIIKKRLDRVQIIHAVMLSATQTSFYVGSRSLLFAL